MAVAGRGVEVGLERRLTVGPCRYEVAVFLASEKASGMMGTTVNLTMGSLDD